ncbi:cytochrome P-450 reductase [Artemisia annua]|uniref:Cytochrome P-450 reductase n=1 Tax=Artemisia annua TaxID=35608 RepID=A0A2U1KCT7_ARTAN|nr:cytochrome P-450 reductase [Artemisia annua]
MVMDMILKGTRLRALQSALLALPAHAIDSTKADRLKSIAFPAGKDEYAQWIVAS